MEPLKNSYNRKYIQAISAAFVQQTPSFNEQKFIDAVFCSDWSEYELKQRTHHIASCLNQYLSGNYQQKIKLLMPVSAHFGGYEAMVFPGFIERFGLQDYEISIKALEYVTQFSSSEFAVRPFIVKYPEKMMAQMLAWAGSDNHHVRRLASEGCRPRLPWAGALAEFKKKPKAILPILEKLKTDSSDYVRKSVANNLNDISKDNVDIVVTIAQRWKGKSKDTDWIVKHACRTLLKQAQPDIMSLYGYKQPDHVSVLDLICTRQLKIGQQLHFSFSLQSENQAIGLCRLEFAVYFMKANKKQRKKLFKISESEIKKPTKYVEKFFSFEPRSTRKLYVGAHSLSIIVNGVELKKSHFLLVD